MFICLQKEILNNLIPESMLYKFRNSHGIMEEGSTLESARTSDHPTWQQLINYGEIIDIMENDTMILGRIIISSTSPAINDIISLGYNLEYPNNILIDEDEANEITLKYSFKENN